MRCVPPISGVRPITAPTRPNCADSAAQIMSQASTSSRPAVRQSPWTEASVGNGSSSMRWVIESSSPVRSAAPASDRPLKTLTSTPPVKYLPSALTRSARQSRASSSALRMPDTMSASNRFSGWLSRTRMPRSPSRSSRACSATAQLRRDLGQLALLGLARLAGQPQRVVVVARNHVHVQVEDGLPRDRLAGVEQVDAVAVEPVAHAEQQPLRGGDRVLEVFVGRLVEVARVVARDHQRVAARPRVDVHESDRVLVLLDDLGRQLAGHDLAEEAVVGVVWHGRAAYSQPTRLK